MLKGKGLQVLNDLGKLGEDEVEGSLLEDEIGIVGDCRCQPRWVSVTLRRTRQTYHSSWWPETISSVHKNTTTLKSKPSPGEHLHRDESTPPQPAPPKSHHPHQHHLTLSTPQNPNIPRHKRAHAPSHHAVPPSVLVVPHLSSNHMETHTKLLLVLIGHLERLVRHDDVLAHLGNGVVRDVEPQLLLGLGQPDPQLAPGRGAGAGREDGHHLGRGIARAEGGLGAGLVCDFFLVFSARRGSLPGTCRSWTWSRCWWW